MIRVAGFVNGDFFAMSHSADGFDPDAPGRRFDAVLVDIDHSPRNLLHSASCRAVRAGGTRRACKTSASRRRLRAVVERPSRRRLPFRPGGAFATSAAHVVTFDNLLGDGDASNTVYVAVKADLPVGKPAIEPLPAAPS